MKLKIVLSVLYAVIWNDGTMVRSLQRYLTIKIRPKSQIEKSIHHQWVKVVITLNWGKDKNLHKMLKIQQMFPKLHKDLLYVVFHNLESQNARLVDVKKDFN